MTRPTAARPSSALLAGLRRWVARRRAAAIERRDVLALRGMSDRELNDLGIGRCEIQEWSRRRPLSARPGTPEPREEAARLRNETVEAGISGTRRAQSDPAALSSGAASASSKGQTSRAGKGVPMGAPALPILTAAMSASLGYRPEIQ